MAMRIISFIALCGTLILWGFCFAGCAAVKNAVTDCGPVALRCAREVVQCIGESAQKHAAPDLEKGAP